MVNEAHQLTITGDGEDDEEDEKGRFIERQKLRMIERKKEKEKKKKKKEQNIKKKNKKTIKQINKETIKYHREKICISNKIQNSRDNVRHHRLPG